MPDRRCRRIGNRPVRHRAGPARAVLQFLLRTPRCWTSCHDEREIPRSVLRRITRSRHYPPAVRPHSHTTGRYSGRWAESRRYPAILRLHSRTANRYQTHQSETQHYPSALRHGSHTTTGYPARQAEPQRYLPAMRLPRHTACGYHTNLAGPRHYLKHRATARSHHALISLPPSQTTVMSRRSATVQSHHDRIPSQMGNAATLPGPPCDRPIAPRANTALVGLSHDAFRPSCDHTVTPCMDTTPAKLNHNATLVPCDYPGTPHADITPAEPNHGESRPRKSTISHSMRSIGNIIVTR